MCPLKINTSIGRFFARVRGFLDKYVHEVQILQNLTHNDDTALCIHSGAMKTTKCNKMDSTKQPQYVYLLIGERKENREAIGHQEWIFARFSVRHWPGLSRSPAADLGPIVLLDIHQDNRLLIPRCSQEFIATNSYVNNLNERDLISTMTCSLPHPLVLAQSHQQDQYTRGRKYNVWNNAFQSDGEHATCCWTPEAAQGRAKRHELSINFFINGRSYCPSCH